MKRRRPKIGWFEFHSSVEEDPRIDVLGRSLRLSIPLAIGHWTLLCSWAERNPRAFIGDLSVFTPEAIAKAARFPGDPVAWVTALIQSEMLSRDPSGPPIKAGEILGAHTSIVGWIDFCGEPCRKRIERHTAAANGIHMAADPLEALLFSFKGSTASKPLNAVWSLFLLYKYVKKGRDKTAVKEDKRWDLLNKDRQLPWLKKIVEAYEGDVKKAGQAVLDMGAYYDGAGLSWDASTIHKRLTDYEEGRFGRS